MIPYNGLKQDVGKKYALRDRIFRKQFLPLCRIEMRSRIPQSRKDKFGDTKIYDILTS
jgi:hypothetical protein